MFANPWISLVAKLITENYDYTRKIFRSIRHCGRPSLVSMAQTIMQMNMAFKLSRNTLRKTLKTSIGMTLQLITKDIHNPKLWYYYWIQIQNCDKPKTNKQSKHDKANQHYQHYQRKILPSTTARIIFCLDNSRSNFINLIKLK